MKLVASLFSSRNWILTRLFLWEKEVDRPGVTGLTSRGLEFRGASLPSHHSTDCPTYPLVDSSVISWNPFARNWLTKEPSSHWTFQAASTPCTNLRANTTGHYLCLLLICPNIIFRHYALSVPRWASLYCHRFNPLLHTNSMDFHCMHVKLWYAYILHYIRNYIKRRRIRKSVMSGHQQRVHSSMRIPVNPVLKKNIRAKRTVF